MFASLGLLSLLTVSGGPPAAQPAAPSSRTRVEVWTNRGDDPYNTGQPARVSFRTEQDAYVTILRVDTDGRVRVLFPREPWEDNFARGGRDYEVTGGGEGTAFFVDDYPGVGYIFAVTAPDPFVYDAIESGDHWDYRVIADGRIRGDPYVALTDLAQRIVPDGYTDWDYDIVPYYVQQHYDYPRFLCYDCHSYVSYPFWSPYDYTCVRFRIVLYDDPYYYPYRYYGGTRVVFTRPLRPEPRFIFKDRQGSDAFITRVRERSVNDEQRRDVGVRGRDLGGIGVIPPPNVRQRVQRSTGGDQGGSGDDGRGHGRPRERPDHPDHPDHPDRPDRPGNPRNPDRPDRPLPPDHRDRPDHPDRSDRPAPPDRPDRPDRGGREPAPEGGRRAEPPPFVPPPRAEPRRESPPERVQRPAPPAAAPPRSEPRAAPTRDASRDRPRNEPELKRRKP
jgi:uncharacterized protein DUF4384